MYLLQRKTGMRAIFRTGIILSFLFVIGNIKGQEDIENAQQILDSDPLENIIIHTDRDIYLSGEKIWFKAYCLNDENTLENTLSNILYVELFNHSKGSIIKRKFKIVNGTAQGVMEIPKEFPSENYYLRAYTQFLKNYPPETYFTTSLSIINPLNSLQEERFETDKNQIDIYPEYGKFIHGSRTKVAFRIHNHKSADFINFWVANDQNEIIAKPQTTKNGLGVFEIIPDKSDNYFLNLVLNNNDTIIKALPKTQSEGITINYKSLNDKSFAINITQKSSSEEHLKKDYLFSILSENNQILFETPISLEKERSSYTFPKDNLKSGINIFRINDLSGNTQLAYAIYHGDFHEILVNFDQGKKVYSQKELLKLTLEFKNQNIKERSNLAISVVKKGTYSELPTYIFDDPQLLRSYCRNMVYASLHENQQDILMILYNDLLSSKILKNDNSLAKSNKLKWMPEIRDVSISGVVYNKETKLPEVNIPIYVSVFKNNPQIHIKNTQSNGEFIFSLNNVEETQEIFLCPISDFENEVDIRINNDFSNKYPQLKTIPLKLNSNHASFLKELFINQQTNELYKISTSSELKPVHQYPSNLSKPQISVLLSDFIDLNSLETVFREIVPKCMVRKKGDQYLIHVVDVQNYFNSENPLILVDHIPVFSVNELFKINPSKIKKIEVSPTNIILGDNLIKGLIMLTTDTEDFGGMNMPKSSTFLEYQTISKTHLFKPISGVSAEDPLNRLANFRTTLYWNPELILEKEKSIQFYTSDHCSEYDVIVRGVTNDGENCYGKASFMVNKK
jgi:hypothetical protein